MTALISLIGEDHAVKLARYYEGARIPSVLTYLRMKRDTKLVNDWLEGASVAELEAKYGLDREFVEAVISEGIAARKKALRDKI